VVLSAILNGEVKTMSDFERLSKLTFTEKFSAMIDKFKTKLDLEEANDDNKNQGRASKTNNDEELTFESDEGILHWAIQSLFN